MKPYDPRNLNNELEQLLNQLFPELKQHKKTHVRQPTAEQQQKAKMSQPQTSQNEQLMKKEIENLKNSLNSANKDKQYLSSELTKLKKYVEQYQQSLNHYQNCSSDYYKKYKDAIVQISETNKNLKFYQDNAKILKETLDVSTQEFTQEIQSLKKKVKELESYEQESKKVDNRVEILQKEVQMHENHKKQCLKRIETLEKENQTLGQTFDKTLNKFSDLEKKYQENKVELDRNQVLLKHNKKMYDEYYKRYKEKVEKHNQLINSEQKLKVEVYKLKCDNDTLKRANSSYNKQLSQKQREIESVKKQFEQKYEKFVQNCEHVVSVLTEAEKLFESNKNKCSSLEMKKSFLEVWKQTPFYQQGSVDENTIFEQPFKICENLEKEVVMILKKEEKPVKEEIHTSESKFEKKKFLTLNKVLFGVGTLLTLGLTYQHFFM